MSVNIFKNGILSKIAGAVGDAVPLINNFLTNQEGKGAADANTVYVLNNKIEELNSSLGGLSSSLEWKLLSSTIGYNKITLPDNFNELFVNVDANNSGNTLYSFLLPRIALSTEEKRFVNANTNDNDGFCCIKATLSNIYIEASYFGHTNIGSSAKMTVYYR